MDRAPFVVHEDEAAEQLLPQDAGTIRVPIDGSVGARNLVQRVLHVRPGRTEPEHHDRPTEDVVFVVAGAGRADLDGRSFDLEPGTGLLVRPGTTYRFASHGPGDLHLVSVLSPPPGGPRPGTEDDGEPAGAVGLYTVQERDQPPLPAGEDRTFRLLIDARSGCRNVTQFVGEIRTSRAPEHVHTYEEAVYILSGRGIVHLSDGDRALRPGTSVFLPLGVPHCLENTQAEPLRLLGVFSPPGSPAAKEESQG